MEYSIPEDTLFYARKERELNERLKRLIEDYELEDSELEFDLNCSDDEEDV